MLVKLTLLSFCRSIDSGSGRCISTFAIHNEYGFSNGVIHHFDIHRIENDDDLESTGFWDVLIQINMLLLLSWADRLEDSVWPIGWSF